VNSYKIKKHPLVVKIRIIFDYYLEIKKIKKIKKVFKYLKKTMVCLTTLILLLKKKTINNGVSECFYPK
jgi:hypothetical protein